MDEILSKRIVKLYKEGFTIRQIVRLISRKYGREIVRKELKKCGVILRGRGAVYKNYRDFTPKGANLFTEFLGYLYGDGSLHKYKNTRHGKFDCRLYFALDEADLVEKVSALIRYLFQFTPKVMKGKSNYDIKFKKSFAKYLYLIGYPAGKKSIINPSLPTSILTSLEFKKSFIRGFLNAEASINNTLRTIVVQQSVRMAVPKEIVKKLCQNSRSYSGIHSSYSFVNWVRAKEILNTNNINLKNSNILLGIKHLLSDLKIHAKIYPVRLYIGKDGNISVHYELHIAPQHLAKVTALNIITCKKKQQKLNMLLRG